LWDNHAGQMEMMCEVTCGCLDRVLELKCYITPTSHTCDPERGPNKPNSRGGGYWHNPHPVPERKRKSG
jgi:hypothetical protein